MHLNLILPTTLLLASAAHTATANSVVASNNALTHRADRIDTAVIAITPQTPLQKALKVPVDLENLTNAMASDLATSNHTTATSDPTTESNIVRSWGLFANTIEELMADYVDQTANLIGVFGLQSLMYSQILAFNTTFQEYAALMVTTVGDSSYQTTILENTADATGNAGSGIIEAENSYAPA